MTERTHSILEAGIRDYIKTGEPITSEQLFRFYDFGIKPAMIRWELNDLSEQGFLTQLHPSGGRMPTDKAYRFFVNNILEDEETVEGRFFRFANELSEEFAKGAFNNLVHDLSNHLKLLSIGYEMAAERIYESGLEALFSNLDVMAKEGIVDVIRDFERLPERLEEISPRWRKDDDWPKVFIGENPLTKSADLSLIADCLNLKGNYFILVAIGPKRMDYQKSLKVFKNLKKTNGRKK